MIPKQTPVRNFRPAAPPQTSLFSSLPLAPPRKSASSSSLIRPLCVQSQTLYRNHLRRQVRPRIACCITLPTSSSVPPFPQDLSQEKSFRASRPSSPNLPLPENRTRRKCLVSQSFAAARPLPHRLPSCTAASSSVPPFPQGLSWEGKLCASSPSSRNIRFPNCAARLYALYRNRRRQSRPAPSAILHCPRHLPSRLSARFVPGR